MSGKLEMRLRVEAAKRAGKKARVFHTSRTPGIRAGVFVERLFMLRERRISPECTKRLVQVVQAFHAAFAQSVGYCQPGKHMQHPTENPILFTVSAVRERQKPLSQKG